MDDASWAADEHSRAGDELPPVFYELVGRVVVSTTELETALVELLLLVSHGGLPPVDPEIPIEEQAAVAAHRQARIKWGKESGTTVVDKLERLVPTATRVPDESRQELMTHLSACCAAVNARHGVTHSVWLLLSETTWWGTRYPRSNVDEADVDTGVATIESSEKLLRQRAVELRRLVHWTNVWRERLTANGV